MITKAQRSRFRAGLLHAGR